MLILNEGINHRRDTNAQVQFFVMVVFHFESKCFPSSGSQRCIVCTKSVSNISLIVICYLMESYTYLHNDPKYLCKYTIHGTSVVFVTWYMVHGIHGTFVKTLFLLFISICISPYQKSLLPAFTLSQFL